MLSILATVVALSVLILVHEFGHFFAAKSVGIAAPRFSLGLGPRVAGFQWGETEFVISAIPLGGYVKMAGMEDDEGMEVLEGGEAAPPVDPARTFDAKPLWARVWVISAGVIMNLLFAFVVNVGLFAAQGEPHFASRVAPAADLPGPAAQLAALPVGARVTAVGDQAVERYDDLQRALERAPEGTVALRLEGRAEPFALRLPAAGPARDSLLAGMEVYIPPVLSTVIPGEPAAKAGLRDGDRVVSVNGQPVATWPHLVQRIRDNPGKPLRLEVVRGAERVAVTVTPEAAREKGKDGEARTVGRVGAGPMAHPRFERVGFGGAIVKGAQETYAMVELLLVTLRDLFTGALSPRNLGGLLAIGEASGQSAEQGAASYFFFLAFLSVNLAVLNLLPIPILDGGHLMFLAIEAVRGRPLSLEARIRLSHVGLIIVVGLMLWANGNDVVRLVERYLAR